MCQQMSVRHLAGASLILLLAVSAVRADSRQSIGNTDGFLTWKVGSLQAGDSAREVVLFAFDTSHEKAASRLDEARRRFAKPFAPLQAGAAVASDKTSAPAVVWIKNDTTDFALAGPGHFFWEGLRQSLTGPKGGQLSRFGYYLHYSDGGPRRAGTPITDKQAENLRIVRPIRRIDAHNAAGEAETTDGKLRIRLHATMGAGPVAAIEFVLTNVSDKPLGDVRLSAYANLESAHTFVQDYSTLDTDTDGLLTVDPPSGTCVVMAGLDRPASGYSGTWPSQTPLESATGAARQTWQKFTAVPPDAKQQLARAPRGAMPHPPAGRSESTEPATRDLSREEALALVHDDWLFQADFKPTIERSLQEITWARELAARLEKNPKTPDLSRDLAELAGLERRLESLDKTNVPPDTAKDLYLAVRTVKRRIMFQNPAINFSKVLLIDNPYPQGSEWQHQARHRNGMMAVPGGRLLLLEGLSPGGHVRKLAPKDKPGSFWRPDISFDGKKILFCYKAYDEKSFHLYEINLDGTGLKQLTSGDYDDIDPIYLPDGHILFTTTRGNTYVRCMPYTYCYVLARCDADGGNIYLVSRNNEPDWCPAVLNDGRVCYSRWEYHDKALWRIESLWSMNQDGTGVAAFWGNQSVWPDHLAEPRPIPGSDRVMFTGVAHHNWFEGSVGIIDQAKGFNFPDGLTKVTCDVPWPECGTPPSDPKEAADYHRSGDYRAYKTPYPLSEEDFLVSARPGPLPNHFQLMLMDTHGNRELIYKGHYNVWHATAATARPRPRRQPDRVAWPGTGKHRQATEPGVFFSADVYEGVPDLPRGMVKYVRVLQMDARTYSTWQRDGRFSGPVVSAVQDDGVKRILGTVPVEPDGSVAFQVPAGRVLHFQLLDEKYRALQTMRSFTGVMPGERRGCVGCHETHSTASVNKPTLALKHGPKELTPPPWGAESISYERLVQPVLDRYCGKCHEGDGKARDKFDMTLRPGRGPFKEPYLSLVGYARFNRVGIPPGTPGIAGALLCENFDQRDPAAYKTFRPLRHLSYTSKLIRWASTGEHYGARVDPRSLRQLIGWVDANCPFRGDREIRAIPDPDFAGIESLPIRPRTRTAPHIPRP